MDLAFLLGVYALGMIVGLLVGRPYALTRAARLGERGRRAIAEDASRWRHVAYQLWRRLDDIDSLDDSCRGSDALFRKAARTRANTRWDVLSERDADFLYEVHGHRDGMPSDVRERLKAQGGG